MPVVPCLEVHYFDQAHPRERLQRVVDSCQTETGVLFSRFLEDLPCSRVGAGGSNVSENCTPLPGDTTS
jgi:hypothetical protein